MRFRIDFEKSNNITSNGYDLVRFMISTNPGQDLRPLSKIASGGELSRIMLAIKRSWRVMTAKHLYLMR